MSESSGRHTDAVARIYATSLLALAEQDGGAGAAQSAVTELEDLAKVAARDAGFQAFLGSRIISTEKKEASLKRMFGDGVVSDLVLRFLLVLNRKDRLAHLDEIAAAATSLRRERMGQVEVEVDSATPMDERQLEDVRKRIFDAIGQEPVLHTRVDASMIGGLRLRIGDRLIDGSLAAKLRTMRESLTEAGATAARTRVGAMIEE